MVVARIALASLAVAALLAVGAVVAVAAPDALGRAASPKAGATGLEYCPPLEKKQLLSAYQWAQSHAAAQRTAYFKTHKKAKDRNAFVKAQQAKLRALKQASDKCN